MNRTQAIREVASLASGTLAGLYRAANYEEIDRLTAAWVAWIEARPEDARWGTWQDCWAEYRGSGEAEGYLSLAEAGREVGVFWRTVAKWVHQGRIQATSERPEGLIARAQWRAFRAEYGV